MKNINDYISYEYVTQIFQKCDLKINEFKNLENLNENLFENAFKNKKELAIHLLNSIFNSKKELNILSLNLLTKNIKQFLNNENFTIEEKKEISLILSKHNNYSNSFRVDLLTCLFKKDKQENLDVINNLMKHSSLLVNSILFNKKLIKYIDVNNAKWDKALNEYVRLYLIDSAYEEKSTEKNINEIETLLNIKIDKKSNYFQEYLTARLNYFQNLNLNAKKVKQIKEDIFYLKDELKLKKNIEIPDFLIFNSSNNKYYEDLLGGFISLDLFVDNIVSTQKQEFLDYGWQELLLENILPIINSLKKYNYKKQAVDLFDTLLINNLINLSDENKIINLISFNNKNNIYDNKKLFTIIEKNINYYNGDYNKKLKTKLLLLKEAYLEKENLNNIIKTNKNINKNIKNKI